MCPRRRGRTACVAGQGSVKASLREAEWGRWGLAPMGFLSHIPTRQAQESPACTVLFKGPQILERVWVLETKPPEGREPDSQAPAPRVPAGE